MKGNMFVRAFFKVADNVNVLCAVGDFENETFSLPQKSDRITNV